MNILAWILFGLVVGIIANAIDPNPSYGGIVGASVLGILGALLGGFLGDLFFGAGVSGFNLYSFVIAVIGSLLVLTIARSIRRV